MNKFGFYDGDFTKSDDDDPERTLKLLGIVSGQSEAYCNLQMYFMVQQVIRPPRSIRKGIVKKSTFLCAPVTRPSGCFLIVFSFSLFRINNYDPFSLALYILSPHRT